MKKIVFAVLLMLCLTQQGGNALAGNWPANESNNYTPSGKVLTSDSSDQGLVLMIDHGDGTPSIPANCAGTPYGWLLVPSSNKVMIAHALMAIATKQEVQAYTSGFNGYSWCVISQLQATPNP